MSSGCSQTLLKQVGVQSLSLGSHSHLTLISRASPSHPALLSLATCDSSKVVQDFVHQPYTQKTIKVCHTCRALMGVVLFIFRAGNKFTPRMCMHLRNLLPWRGQFWVWRIHALDGRLWKPFVTYNWCLSHAILFNIVSYRVNIVSYRVNIVSYRSISFPYRFNIVSYRLISSDEPLKEWTPTQISQNFELVRNRSNSIRNVCILNDLSRRLWICHSRRNLRNVA
jgi:hypothetical protein